MTVQVINNSQTPIYIDTVGDGAPQNTFVIGARGKETLSFHSKSQVDAIKAQFGNKVSIKTVGGI